jgi:nucleoside-diphosphate-sugar epimerase
MIINNRKVVINNNGLSTMDIIHINDACRAIDICFSHGLPNETYNISNSNPVSTGNLARYIHASIKGNSELQFTNNNECNIRAEEMDVWLDNRKINSLGYKPYMMWKEACDSIIDKIK